jgi:hypothetical protein
VAMSTPRSAIRFPHTRGDGPLKMGVSQNGK